MTKAKDLTEHQRKEFTEHFYDQWIEREMGAAEDTSSPLPYGCPWLYRGDGELYGHTIKEMAINYFLICKTNIKKDIASSKEAIEEGGS